jgi:hypothetical protein
MGTDQGNKLVYVLNDKDEVVSRRVKQGVLQNGNREVTEGLGPDDRVIVSGLQRVRPGVKVAPKWSEEKGGKTPEPAKGEGKLQEKLATTNEKSVDAPKGKKVDSETPKGQTNFAPNPKGIQIKEVPQDTPGKQK